jgi:hypothetical protein
MIEHFSGNRSLTESTITNSSNLISKDHVWGVGIAVSIAFAILSLTLTSFIVCCYHFKVRKEILKGIIFSLISLSIGSLFGDAVIHIIPEIFVPHSEEHAEEEIHEAEEEGPVSAVTSALIVVGFLVFFLIEKAFVLGNCSHNHSEDFEFDDHHHKEDHESSENKNIKGKNIIYVNNYL